MTREPDHASDAPAAQPAPKRKLGAVACLALVIALAAAAGPARAYIVAPGWSVTDYVTGFSFAPGYAGPVGVAFDGGGNLFVADTWARALYKAPPGGGTAASTLLRDHYADPGAPGGLAFGRSGRLYMTRPSAGDIVEISPATGQIIRTVVDNLPCPLGLATDPVTGDLFTSNTCGGDSIMRIRGIDSGAGTASYYATVDDPDGLTFAPDGTLYAAGAGSVLRITGTGSGTPGAVSRIATLPGADGVAFAPATPGSAAFLVVVRTDGEVDRLDLDGSVSAVVTGASRGDLVTVGPDQCMYADLQDRVIKIGPANGTCAFALPAGGGPGESGGTSGTSGTAGQQSQQAPVVNIAVATTGPKRARLGRLFTVTVKVSNRSTNMAHAPRLTNTLPRGTRFVRARWTRGVTCKRRKRAVVCTTTSLRGGDSFTVKITLRGVRGRTWTDSARVRSSDLDPEPGNNQSRSRTLRR